MAYEIGYRRPPKSGRFKKGSTGNTRGRPKGSRNFSVLLEKELAQPILINENGKKKKVSRMEAIVKRLVTGALQGDQKSLFTLFEIARRTGQFEKIDAATLLPDNYEAVLESYIARHQKGEATIRISPREMKQP